MKTYRVAVVGYAGAGVTAACVICEKDFEAKSEVDARAMAMEQADEKFPDYAPFNVLPRFV